MKNLLLILTLILAFAGQAYSQVKSDTINTDIPGRSWLDSTDIDTIAELNAIITPDVVDLSSAQSLLNKTIGGDANTVKMLRHATDCSTYTGAVDGQYCWEQDADLLYVCETADVCDTAAEWDKIDTFFFLDAADIVAQRNGTTAQEFRVYNIDSGANDEFAMFSWKFSANRFDFGPWLTGTGAQRSLYLHSGGQFSFMIGGGEKWRLTGSSLFALTDNAYTLGTLTERFSTIYSYNLNTRGTSSVYGLDDGAGNTEFLSMTYDATDTRFEINSLATGTGIRRPLWIAGLDDDSGIDLDGTNSVEIYANAAKIALFQQTLGARFGYGIMIAPNAASDSTRNLQIDVNNVTTSDATVTTIRTIGTLSGAVYALKVTVVGISSTGADAAHYVFYVTYKNVGGTVTQVGSSVYAYSVESNAAWNADTIQSGTDILIRVTGVAATSIKWTSTVEELN